MNSTNNHRVRSALLLTTVLALTACGGGGGGSSPAPSPSPAPAPAPGPAPAPDTAPYALQLTAPAPTYAGTDDSGVMETATFNLLNTVRQGAGAGVLLQSTQLDTSARAHSNYLQLNPTEFSHNETAGRQGYTGDSPQARATAAGYTGAAAEEIVGLATLTPPNADGCVRTLLKTMYHMAGLIDGYRDLGVGYKRDVNGAGYCVLNLGYKGQKQYPAAGTVVTYPFDGQTDAAYNFSTSAEFPRPPAVLTGYVGQPVLASMGSLALVTGDGTNKGTVTTFKITEKASGNIVPAIVAAPSSITVAAGIEKADDSANDQYYQRHHVLLVPKSPLLPNTGYTVTFAGTFNGVAHSKTWSFTTGQ